MLGVESPDALAGLAAELMAKGVSAPSLTALAGLDRVDHEEVRNLVMRTLTELGLPQITNEQAMRLYVSEVSSLIDQSDLPPLEGARRIWRARNRAGMERSHEFDVFVYAASECEERPEDKELFESAIREEAKRVSAETP